MTNRSIQSIILTLAVVATNASLVAAQNSGTSSTTTAGAPAGDSSIGNGATGSGAAPTGK